ncbi:MAG: carbohydrate-binding protein, partial [Clostridia bacterium]|nr:carbohydrate-binding protein [Clostridia bacterium]
MFDDRISIEPFPARRGQKVNITYRGLLAKSGADAVWMHYGYDGWKSLGWAQMSKLPDGSFVAN